MWEKVGVVRNKEDLKKALATFAQLRYEDIPNLSGNDIFSALETANLLFAAEIITTSALEREESRGAHNRSDYPQQDDQKWSKHVCITDSAGNINVSTVPVVTLKI
jgi:succinate dehydrogenase/fumarate reductase flavoprotein subunit